MRICASGSERRECISGLRPHSIAVAFVGHAWNQFVDEHCLKSMIVSTALGSNPYAIERITNAIGMKNVYFLDNLHSKIYLGHDGVLVGSANLSKNGFSDDGNHEFCVFLDSEGSIKKVEMQYQEYLEEAKRQYPTVKSRQKILKSMFDSWQQAIAQGINPPDADAKPTDIRDFTGVLAKIHISYWAEDGADFNAKEIARVHPGLREVDVDDYISESMQFLEEDRIEPGEWILCWKNKKNGKPIKNSPVEWMYVSEVIPNGFEDDTYTKLAGCSVGTVVPPEPFEITKEVAAEVRRLLDSGRYPELLAPTNDEAWSLTHADGRVAEFLAELKGAQQFAAGRRP